MVWMTLRVLAQMVTSMRLSTMETERPRILQLSSPLAKLRKMRLAMIKLIHAWLTLTETDALTIVLLKITGIYPVGGTDGLV